MRRLLVMFCAIVGFTFTSQAQEGFRGGAHLGIYLFEISDSFYVGGASGYTQFFGSDIAGLGSIEDFGLIPVAASALYSQGDQSIIAGADLGYAFLTNFIGNDGGFYYNPFVGYDFGAFEATVTYEGVSVDDATVSGLFLGATFGGN